MKKKFIIFCMMCTLLPALTHAQNGTESSHHQLPSSIDFPINRVSPDGRYMGGWISGITHVYDTETEQTLTIGDPSSLVYLVRINNDGSIWASRIGSEGLQYGLYKDGQWTDLPKPDGFTGGWLRDVTSDGKFAINSYTNTMEDYTLISDAFLYTRLDNGTYEYQKLVKPKSDCWTDSEVYHVDPMQISSDGEIILGHVVDGLGKYTFPIIWKRNAEGEYDYKIKGESLCFHLDLQAPGNPPVEDEMVTAEPGTSEYDQQVAEYQAAVENWNALANAYFTGQALSGYPIMNNIGTIIGADLFTGDPNKGSQPALLSVADDTYTLLEYYFTKTKLVCDNGVAFLVNEFMDGINHNVVYSPESTDIIYFDKWLESEYGLILEPEYNDGVRISVGDPALSEDGKTLTFTLKKPDGIFKNHYYHLNKSLNIPTSVAVPEENVEFRIYTNGKTLFINDKQPYDIRVVNMEGKSVAQQKNVIASLDLNQLSAGIYVVVVSHEGKTESFKVMLSD